MKKMYISGQITGIEDRAPVLFQLAEEEVKALGHEPVNPMTIQHKDNSTWQDFMRADIKAMCDCEAIYMLDNWSKSKGATIELRIAQDLGLEIHYQEKAGSIKEKLDRSFEKVDLLDRYSRFLEKHGYTDTDWWQEKPTSVETFLEEESEEKKQPTYRELVIEETVEEILKYTTERGSDADIQHTRYWVYSYYNDQVRDEKHEGGTGHE